MTNHEPKEGAMTVWVDDNGNDSEHQDPTWNGVRELARPCPDGHFDCDGWHLGAGRPAN